MMSRLSFAVRKTVIAAIPPVLFILAAVLAPLLAPHDPYATNALSIRTAPCMLYPFGTDNLGRCVLSRVLFGARTTLAATFFLVALTFIFGTCIGMFSALCGGVIDTLLMRFTDIFLSFPQMVVAIAVAGILGGGLTSALIALGITMWTGFARLARSHTFSVMHQPFIQAAQLAGKSRFYIMLIHILPNILAPVLTNALTQIGTTMIGISGLSFLGLGVVPPKAEWGSMINEARAYIQIAPWAVLFPTLASILAIICFNYLGDAVMALNKAEEEI